MSRVSLPRTMRRRRTVATAALAVVATIALVGCENKASTAAFVGDHRISDEDLRRTVDDALDHPAVKKLVDERLGDNANAAYRRVILDNEVQHMLVEQAADRLDVDVASSAVDERLTQIAAGAGGVEHLDDLFASNGLTPEAGRRVVRDETLLTEIGYASGAPRADEAELRRSYEAARPQFTSLTLGIIQVPDDQTAQSVLGQLRDDPEKYADLAAQHADGATMPQPQTVSLTEINPTLLTKLEPVRAGDGIVFSQPAQAGGPGLFAVIYLVNRQVAPFESVRSQLEADKIAAAQSAANTYLSKLAKDLKVRVNPRYGKWDYTQNHIADLPDPLVKLPSLTGPGDSAGQPQSGADGAAGGGAEGGVPPEGQQPPPQN